MATPITPTLPPDRGRITTEQRHEQSMHFDTLSPAQCVHLLVEDHERAIDAVRCAADQITLFVEALVPRFSNGGRLIYLGAGTSGRLGVLDASECPPTFQAESDRIIGLIAGGDAALRTSSEAKEDDASGARTELERLNINKRDTVLGIAAGGTTPYVLGGIKIAAEFGARTGLLTCAVGIDPQTADHVLILNTGPELLTGSTRLKAGTATKLAINTITTTLFVQLGKTYGNLMVDIRATNNKLADRAIRILTELFPALSREESLALLKEAGGYLKTAIVMHALATDPKHAAALLEEEYGVLRAVIGAR